MCTFLAVSKQIKTTLGLGVAVIVVEAISVPLNPLAPPAASRYARTRIIAEIESRTGFPAEVGSVNVHPFSGAVEVINLALRNPGRFVTRDFLTIDKLEANVALLSLFYGTREAAAHNLAHHAVIIAVFEGLVLDVELAILVLDEAFRAGHHHSPDSVRPLNVRVVIK